MSNTAEGELTEKEKAIFKALGIAVDYGWIPEHVQLFQYLKQIKQMENFLDTYEEQRLTSVKEKVKGLYDEDDPQDYKDAIFDVLNAIPESEIEEELQ